MRPSSLAILCIEPFMAKQFFGKTRFETLDWLLNVWLKEGPPVCFLQGFPGVGKTDLARDLRAAAA